MFRHSIPPQNVLDEAMKVAELSKEGLNDERTFMRKTGCFPVTVFPKVFQDFIMQGVKAFASPPDYIALSLLNVVSVALGNAYQLQYKKTWDKKPCQWSGIVGYSGSNKSASVKLPLSVLKKLQKENMQRYKEELNQYEFEMMKYNRKLKEWAEAVFEERADLSDKPKEPEKPAFKQLIVKDATIETIPDIAKNNPRGFIKYHDELVGFIKSMDQYKSNGNERQQWLELKDGQDLTVNRKGIPVLLSEKPFVNILGTIQPERLPELVGKNKGDKGDGLAQRFLYVWPDETYYKEDDNYEMDDEVIQKYEDVIRKIYHSHEGKEHDPVIMIFEEKARTLFSDFRREFKKEKSQPDFPGALDSVWEKMRGEESLGMCIIIHAMRYFTGEADDIEKIDEITVEKSITIIEYLKTQSRKVFTFLDSSEADQRILKIVEHMKRRATEIANGYRINISDLNSSNALGKGTNIGMINETISEMEKQGYGKVEEFKNLNNKPTRLFTLFY